MLKNIKKVLKPYKWLHHMLKNKHLTDDELWNSHISFSQFGEDRIVHSLFKMIGIKNGFYIEIGAFDPLLFSNTYLFYKNGWQGLLVEPNPAQYKKIAERRPRDKVLNFAVSSSSRVVDFAINDARLGILDQSYLFPNRKAEGIIQIQAKPLSGIFSQELREKNEIHLMSIDCEGHDLIVLQSNDWARFRPFVILVEDQESNDSNDLESYLKEIGYTAYSRSGLTSIYIEDLFARKYKIKTR